MKKVVMNDIFRDIHMTYHNILLFQQFLLWRQPII